jgi:hypothetical protein
MYRDSTGATVPVLYEVPLSGDDDASVVIVEVDRNDIPGALVLAAPEPGAVTARAKRSLEASIEQLEPLLRTIRDRLTASSPERLEVEFGVKLGGETGIIVAKGTAEVNLKVTMSWSRLDKGLVPGS